MAGGECRCAAPPVGALVIENAAGLSTEEARRWIGALAPSLRPGGRLIAADATASRQAAARVAGVFLSAALRNRSRVAAGRRRHHRGRRAPAPVSDARFSLA